MQSGSVWFVTGASRGLGLTLVQHLLNNGYKVAGTSRKKSSLEKAIGTESENFLPLEVDLTNEDSVKASIAKAESTFGKIDVLVNNAGYGQIGTLEELSDKEVRDNFEVNVFGMLHFIRHSMPIFRKNKSGHIFDISSIGGYNAGFPGWGIYCATKFAVAGLTESLAHEAKEFGINATVVYPGYFRTDFLTGDSLATPANPLEEYKLARQSQQQHQAEINGNQAGDPQKAAELLVEVAESSNPPIHLFLGADAYASVAAKDKVIGQDMAAWKDKATATGFVNQK